MLERYCTVSLPVIVTDQHLHYCMINQGPDTSNVTVNFFLNLAFSHELKATVVSLRGDALRGTSLTYCDGSIWPRRTKRRATELWPRP